MKNLFFTYLMLLCFSNSFASDSELIINNTVFGVELAITPEERKNGLQHRKNLDHNQGMLFIYPEPRIISFWMKHTLITLDILFFDSNGQLLEAFDEVPPCTISPCKKYTNQKPSQFVLEIPGGIRKKLKIVIGDSFETRPVKNGT